MDEADCAALAGYVDDVMPRLELRYGPADEPVNLMCYDFNSPTAIGWTSFWDLYDQCYTGREPAPGNNLPMIHLNAAAVGQGGLEGLCGAAVNELVCLLVCERLFLEGYLEGFITNGDHQNFIINNGDSAMLIAALLGLGAREMVAPGSAPEELLPKWYADGAVWKALGYADRRTFDEEFLLSVLLHDSVFATGKYRLEPFDGCGVEDPFAMLRPIVTEAQLMLHSGGYTVICPAGGTYVPPETADEGLVYIGIKIP